MSHKSTTRLISQLGKDHDQLVKKWRDSFLLDLETQPAPYTEQCENNESSFASDSSESSDDNDESLDDCGSISSGGDDDENDEDCDYNDEDDDNNDDDDDDDNEIFRIPEQCQNGPLIVHPPQVLEASNIIKVLPGLPIEMRHKGFRLCGDNLDKSIHRRHLRSDKRNQSLHFFHAYAVENRIDVSELSDNCPSISETTDVSCAAQWILPKSRDDAAIKDNIAVLISRVLYQYFDFFKLSFDRVIQWHIKHKHYTEMSCKSVVVCYTISMH